VYYPILGSVTQRLKNDQNSILNIAAHELENLPMQILGTVSQESENDEISILGLPTQELQISDNEQYVLHYKELLLTTSYSNLTELVKIEDTVS